ncbi:domain-containing protein 2 [Favolaschia claudopus]|uniref:Domain-containing protein 2 n=1 Tax=Favolaschia claudopus TaxID=2862362 RepID=A0AAW0E7T2_9AGAR
MLPTVPYVQELPSYPTPPFLYLVSLDETNHHLQAIQDGAIIGFDMEGCQVNRAKLSKSGKKARLDQQIRDVRSNNFTIDWTDVETCLVQIVTQGGATFVINLNVMKAMPDELRRICESTTITKVSAGIVADGIRLWDDFRIQLHSAVSLGLLARLAYPTELVGDVAFLHEPSLGIIIHHTLGFKLEKGERRSNWRAIPLKESQKNYAACDPHASLAAYNVLQGFIAARGAPVERSWYCFDVVYRQRAVEGDHVRSWTPSCPWWSAAGFFKGFDYATQ